MAPAGASSQQLVPALLSVNLECDYANASMGAPDRAATALQERAAAIIARHNLQPPGDWEHRLSRGSPRGALRP